jgi:hypothetical protein
MTSTPSRIRTALVTLAIAGTTSAGLLATAPSVGAASSASTMAPAAAAHALGNAPSCVRVWQKVGRVTKTGYARNDCGRRLNIKIVWAHGADGSCQSVPRGWTISHKVPRGVRTFDGASRC